MDTHRPCATGDPGKMSGDGCGEPKYMAAPTARPMTSASKVIIPASERSFLLPGDVDGVIRSGGGDCGSCSSCFCSSFCQRSQASMSSVDVYVQVSAIPQDLSGRASDSPLMVIVEVPGLRIERHREQSPYTGEAADAQLAENLVSEIGPHARWRRPGSIAPCVGLSKPLHFPNARQG